MELGVTITIIMSVKASQLRDNARAFHLQILGSDLNQLTHFVKLPALHVARW